MFDQALILLFVVTFTALSLGVFVLYKNPKKRINISFALLSLASILWINSSYLEDEFSDPNLMNFFLKMDFATGAFFAFFILMFCVDISKSKIGNSSIFRIAMFLIPIGLALLIFLTKLILSGYEIMQNNVINPTFGILGEGYDILVIGALLASILFIILGYKKASKLRKARFIYLFIGFALFAIIVSLTNIVLTDYIENSPNYNLYSRFGTFSSIFLILFSGYSIVRYGLLEIKVIATELLSFGILLFSLIQILLSRNISELTANGIIFLALFISVIMLTRSVRNEVRRKEELQRLSKKLAKANKKLKQLDQAKSEFISIASHQLRTPLGTIKGFASLLLEGSYGEISEKVKKVLEKISISNERLISLVNDLLDLSRIEAGKMQYDFNYWQIEDIVKEIKETLSLKSKEKGLYLKVNFPPRPLPKIKIDSGKIKEVISNLIENAIKYTKKGGVEVNFRQEDNLIKIIVSDTGIGISQNEMPLLFSKFSRGKNVGRIDANGTGLGLFVGRKIIEAHGGRIWAESKGENKGSKFIMELLIDGVRKAF